MAQAYTFDDTDFPSGFDLERFQRQLNADATLGPLLFTIRVSDPRRPLRVDVGFRRNLAAGEELQLLGLVAAHDPTATIPPGHTLRELDARQPGVTAGKTAFCRDARRTGESAGAGSGLLVYSDGAQWLEAATNTRPRT
jgi:hypothetical protein